MSLRSCYGIIMGLLMMLGLGSFFGMTPDMDFDNDFDFPTAAPPEINFPTPTAFVFPTSTATSTPIAAPPAQEGENRGEIGVGGGQAWAYEGVEGTYITLEVQTDNPGNTVDSTERLRLGLLDSYLYVYDPFGVLIASNDDIVTGTITDSRIENLQLPFSGTYTIEVRSWSDASGGAYTLIIETDDAPMPTATLPSTEVPVTATVVAPDASPTFVPSSTPFPTGTQAEATARPQATATPTIQPSSTATPTAAATEVSPVYLTATAIIQSATQTQEASE